MTIAPKYLSNFTLKNTVYEYKGKNVCPTISLAGDYSKTYKNNNKPGFATVTVTGKGNYQGTIQKTFTILPKIKKLSKTKKGIQLSFYNAKTIKIYKKTGNSSWKYYKMNKKKTFLDKNVKLGKTYSYRIYQNGQMSKTVKKKY